MPKPPTPAPGAVDPAAPHAWIELPDGRIVSLSGPLTIGRNFSNALVLEVPGVSREHARLEPNPGGGHRIVDLQSTNGTYLNGRRLDAACLVADQDTILIGEARLTYRCPPAFRPHSAHPGTALVHDGPCWLLLAAGPAESPRGAGAVRAVLERHAASVQACPGDALLACWRQDRHQPAQVHAAVLELLKPPAAGRILVHHGPVRITRGPEGEALSGRELIFLFRCEKPTRPLRAPCVLSESAAASLGLAGAARDLGRHAVPDFNEAHAFFGLGG